VPGISSRPTFTVKPDPTASPGPWFAGLYAYPRREFWSAVQTDVTLVEGTRIGVQKIDLTVRDGLRQVLGIAPPDAGNGVKVALIDAGVGDHPDLAVTCGRVVSARRNNWWGTTD